MEKYLIRPVGSLTWLEHLKIGFLETRIYYKLINGVFGTWQDFIRGIKHDFPFINIRKVPGEVLKTEGEASP